MAYPINTMTCQGRPSDNGRMGLGLGDDGDPCPTLTQNHSHAVAYGFEPGITQREGNPNRFNSEICPTLRANMGDNQVGVAYGCNLRPQEIGLTTELSQTLRASDYKERPAIFKGSVVRRLTPIECEKLQGFPPNFTKIPYRNKSADDCPNGVRYKALGNSMAVNVMAWIGQQINKAVNYENKD